MQQVDPKTNSVWLRLPANSLEHVGANCSSLAPLWSLLSGLSSLGSGDWHREGEGGWLSWGDGGELGCGGGQWEGEAGGLGSGDGHWDGEGGGLGSGDGHCEGEGGGLGSGDGHWEGEGGRLGSGDGHWKGEGGGLGSGDGVGLFLGVLVVVVMLVAVVRCWKRGSWGMFLSLWVYLSEHRPADTV